MDIPVMTCIMDAVVHVASQISSIKHQNDMEIQLQMVVNYTIRIHSEEI
jgi:hypothetical protein